MEKIQIILEPEDNNRLLNLCGPLNSNLKEIELRFDVEINQRGNSFNFLGIKWNDDVLNVNLNQQTIIKTVSNIQVRNKIIKHDLSYLKNYIPLLEKYGIKNLI